MSENQDIKPQVDEGEKISIKVQDEHENQVVYRIKQTTPLSKIFDNYAQKNNVRKDELRFYFDGNKLKDTDSAKLVGLSENDTIEVLRHQVGGQ
ncbi:Sentrin [Spironucleus salmonicida]|uniref:Sentrin n=1 Tax=Spironucleus salmonicida TaxID=348837 RepID=V6LFP8_9EUKA|nr:Sentrin [Spironucleus salmonicida]|eukprot:EST43322.1 Sentrin [Spironucleus salmonicida]